MANSKLIHQFNGSKKAFSLNHLAVFSGQLGIFPPPFKLDISEPGRKEYIFTKCLMNVYIELLFMHRLASQRIRSLEVSCREAFCLVCERIGVPLRLLTCYLIAELRCDLLIVWTLFCTNPTLFGLNVAYQLDSYCLDSKLLRIGLNIVWTLFCTTLLIDSTLFCTTQSSRIACKSKMCACMCLWEQGWAMCIV